MCASLKISAREQVVRSAKHQVFRSEYCRMQSASGHNLQQGCAARSRGVLSKPELQEVMHPGYGVWFSRPAVCSIREHGQSLALSARPGLIIANPRSSLAA